MATKEEYIEKQILELTRSTLSALLIFAAITSLVLTLLDFFVVPENVNKFLVYRITNATFLLILLVILKYKKGSKLLNNFIVLAGTFSSAIMVELMILSFGGHQSPYYAGMIIIFVFVLGFLPLSVGFSALISLITYFIYLIPILLLDNITNLRYFINNNIFLISFAVGGVGWRYYNYNLLINKLSLEYDLAREKEQLKKYSLHLEDVVAERTKELKKSETMLRSLFEQATDGILIMDENGIIIDTNEKACEIYGFDKESLIGTNIEIFETEENKHLWAERKKKLLNGESLFFETQHQRKDGSIVSIEISAKAIDLESGRVIQAFCRDVTEKKRLQQQLLQSQKLESIGQLAGGIAHDFHNFLTVIMGYSELLLQNTELDEKIRKMVRQITKSATQASQIVEKLLRFSRRGEAGRTGEYVKVNINSIINETHELLERFLPRGIEIRKDLYEPLPLVEADPNQIEQVLMNLVINAKDAMPNGGTITINTALAFLDKDEAGVANIKPGEYVKISISDTGKGIPEEDLPHIFEPFFTTKGKDKGTGLGLAMVYGIVKEHEGHITVRSIPNKGTTFDIYLPINTTKSVSHQDL